MMDGFFGLTLLGEECAMYTLFYDMCSNIDHDRET